ncbi:MAG: septum site-determining protein MinC [Lachnospiraceae bacterium]|nr:septum site-determining protein MinC [Lachnospiraceae bacterium]
MSQPVIIKSNRYGINLILDPNIPFQELLYHIAEKFMESEKFFKNARMAISFEGRELSQEEEYRIIEMISQRTSIHIACIIDNDEAREEYTRQRLDAYLAAESGNTGRFYKGTLRSGQVLECDTSVVIMGDVNPDAKIISAGNIVVLGALKGTAYAGVPENEGCFVVALDMNPAQIKIGNIIGRSEKSLFASIRERKKVAAEPQMAMVSNGHILIEPITKNTFNNI